MIDKRKLDEYKATMLLSSEGGAKLLGLFLTGMLQLPSQITEHDFKGGVEYCKAKRKLYMEEHSTYMSETDKQQIERSIDSDVETLAAMLKEFLIAKGMYIKD